MNGQILNIQRFCTDDGPGIRTTVFLKGCPLRCAWCHNPESHSKRAEIMYNPQKCALCGRCVDVCPVFCHAVDGEHKFERSMCIGCGACVDVCSGKALELYGKSITVDETYAEVKRDKVFYEASGGGVTVSGGEPLAQSEFTAELLRKCRENGIHTAIETSGFADEKALIAVLRHCDFVLLDIKETDEEKHKQYTGVSREPIMRNLGLIGEMKIPFLIRAPIIPSLNDREEHFRALASIRDTMPTCRGVQIMPYHRIGSYKYSLLDRDYSCGEIPEPSKELIEAWKTLL